MLGRERPGADEEAHRPFSAQKINVRFPTTISPAVRLVERCRSYVTEKAWEKSSTVAILRGQGRLGFLGDGAANVNVCA